MRVGQCALEYAIRSSPTHDFRRAREYHFPQQATAFLALVDLDSYPPLAIDHPDQLDLLQHLCAQRQALTATMWEVPEMPLQLQLIWAADDWTGERLKTTGHRGVADGYVRTDGRLSLAADNQLLQRRRPRRDPRRNSSAVGEEHQPHILLVPPGVYAISVFNGLASATRQERDSTVGYTVVLRHHPHPAPRLHPVRLGGPFLGEPSAGKPGAITSHTRIY